MTIRARRAQVPDAGHHPRACDGALVRAFEFLGKRWSGVIIATLVGGPAGFAELRRAVGGISDSVLSERLAEMTAAGIVTRSVDDGPPVSVTYRLTAAGEGLAPAIDALTTWAAQNLPAAPSGERLLREQHHHKGGPGEEEAAPVPDRQPRRHEAR